MANIVTQRKKYKVLKTVSYPDPMLGTFVIEAGDVLEECVDSPGYFSNGLCIVTKGNINHKIGEYFELVQPEVVIITKPKKLLTNKGYLNKFPQKRLKG